MKTTKKTDENGHSITRNFMLDNIIESFEKRGMNNDSNDDLIKELTIQKIEYGRTCIAQFLAQGGQNRQTMNGYWKKLDGELRDKIVEVGGKPNDILFD